MTSEYGREAEGDFDEAVWNDRRIELEERLLEAANYLMMYMGCNFITLRDDFDGFVVKVRPKESNESSYRC